MTTNQDSPNTAGAAEIRKEMAKAVFGVLYPYESWDDFEAREDARGGLHPSQLQAYECTDAVLAILQPHPPENPSQRPSVVPDEVVEAILYNVEQVCGPLSTEPCVIAGDDDRSVLTDAVRAALSAIPADQAPGERKFNLGDRVTKTKGSSWTGYVVGFYSTSLTKVGYAVESENEPGSVQIYPESALAAYRKGHSHD